LEKTSNKREAILKIIGNVKYYLTDEAIKAQKRTQRKKTASGKTKTKKE